MLFVTRTARLVAVSELRCAGDQAIGFVDRTCDARTAHADAGNDLGLPLARLPRRNGDAEIPGSGRTLIHLPRAEAITHRTLPGRDIVQPEIRRSRNRLTSAALVAGDLRPARARPIAGDHGSRNHRAIAYPRSLLLALRRLAEPRVLVLTDVWGATDRRTGPGLVSGDVIPHVQRQRP